MANLNGAGGVLKTKFIRKSRLLTPRSTVGGGLELPNGLRGPKTDLLTALELPPPDAAGERRNRFVELDVLRGLAVLLVLVRHSEGLIAGMSGWSQRGLEFVCRGGWIGVDLFFVLSGFLVSGLVYRELDATGQLKLGRFWMRRAFKILPSFWVYLFFLLIVTIWREGNMPWERWLAELLFLQNYLPGLAGHTWSLAVEEHFYWLLPLGLVGLFRRSRYRGLPAVFFGICGLALALRAWTAMNQPYEHRTHLYPTHLRLDALCCGVMLRHLHSHAHEDWLRFMERIKYWGWPLVALLLAPAFCIPLGSNRLLTVFGLTGNLLGFALLISLMLRHGVPTAGPSGFLVRSMARIGTWSYGIYLWHLEILGRLEHYGLARIPSGVLLMMGVCTSIALGAGVTRWIEDPFLRIRDRLCRSSAGVTR